MCYTHALHYIHIHLISKLFFFPIRPVVQYGQNFEFTATDCKVLDSSTIRCRTVEGAGKGHQWRIKIGPIGQGTLTDTEFNVTKSVIGTERAVSVLPINYGNSGASYSVPIVSKYEAFNNLSRLSVNKLTTDGGNRMIIHGKNFGPMNLTNPSHYITRVTYGIVQNGTVKNEFTADNCIIIDAHEKIECNSVIGAGKEHNWVVTIADQESKAPTTAYHKPAISSVCIWDESALACKDPSTELNTQGRDIVRITGTNFGPTKTSSIGQYLERVTYGYSGSEYTCLDARVSRLSTEIFCTTPPGTGKDLKWRVRTFCTFRFT